MKSVLQAKHLKFELEAKLSDDKLKLFLDAKPLSDAPVPVSKAELISVLSPTLAIDLVDQAILDDIAKILSSGKPALERRIAKGSEGEEGRDGRLVLLAKKFIGKKNVGEPGASIGEVHLFDNIKSKQIVARLYPPTAGKPGRDALGKESPSRPGKPIKPAYDATLSLGPSPNPSDNYQVLVAETEGYLSEDSGKLCIKDELVISDNLDYRVGNINFIGKVRIKGDVIGGFTVQGDKGVEVKGAVRGGKIISSAGDIVVAGFAFGGEGSHWTAGGAVHVKVAQELNVDARGEITVEREATDCVFRTQKSLQLLKGRLIGGHSYTVAGATIKDFGNEAYRATALSLCSTVETTPEYLKNEQLISEHDKAITVVSMHLGPYAKNRSRVDLLREPHRGRVKSLLQKLEQVESSRIKLLAKRATMLGAAPKNEEVNVEIIGSIYPGAVVIAGEVRFDVKEMTKGPLTLRYTSKDELIIKIDPK